MKRVCIWLLCLTALCTSCANQKDLTASKRSASSAMPSASSAPSASTSGTSLFVPADQLLVIAKGREALAYLAAKSPAAKEQLAFYDEAAIIGKYEVGVGIRVINTARPGQIVGFFLVADPTPIDMKGESRGAEFANFECSAGSPPGMLLRDGETSKLTRGLILAHEIAHAKDCLLNGEPESKRLSRDWLMGELNAHARVMTILNEWTDGGWKKIVTASRDRRVAETIAKGKRPESSAFGVMEEDRALFIKQFGELDHITQGLLFFQLNVDANISNINLQMKNLGRPEDEAMGHCLDMLRALYGQFMQVSP